MNTSDIEIDVETEDCTWQLLARVTPRSRPPHHPDFFDDCIVTVVSDSIAVSFNRGRSWIDVKSSDLAPDLLQLLEGEADAQVRAQSRQISWIEKFFEGAW